MEQRDVSYGELAELENMFYERVNTIGIVFPDDEIEQECLMDYQQQYIEGNDEPIIRMLWDDPENRIPEYEKKYKELFPEG